MANIREFLYRLRPAGAPGAAGPAGVPADRRADAEQELAAVFAALEEVEATCTQIDAQAEREAQRRTEQAHRMAGALVARARAAATADRAEAAATAVREARDQSDEMLLRARESAARARAAVDERIPQLLPRITARARERIQAVARGGVE